MILLRPEFKNTAWPSSSFISSLSLVLIPSGCWVTSPRFELPMGTTEQPPLPQQTQPPTKVPCPSPSSVLWHCWPWQGPCSRELSACINVWSAIDPARDLVRGLRRRWDRRGVSHAEFQQKIQEAKQLHLSLELEHCLLELNAHLASLPLPGECLGSSAVPAAGARVEGSMGTTCLLLFFWFRSFPLQTRKLMLIEGGSSLR